MDDRNLISEKQFDDAVYVVLDEMVDAGCTNLAFLAAPIFARLGAELFHREEEGLEEKLIRAVSKDDNAQH